MTVRDQPRDGALLDDVCRFEVLLPPGSGRGPMVDRGYIRLLGLDSAPSFRLYLSLCWLWDTHGTFKGRLIGPTVPEVHRDETVTWWTPAAAGRPSGEADPAAARRTGTPSRPAAESSIPRRWSTTQR